MMNDICGFSLPFRIDPTTGGVAWAGGDEKLKENLIHILLTGVGERVMRPGYGGGMRQLLHDPNNEALRAIVQHQIARSIGEWEPRVMLQEVVVTQEAGTLVVRLQYVVRRTQQPQSLSVPIGLGGL
jgi:hypothetical protein